ncbi:hypothetical protein SAMN05192553_1215 [Cyclobacterium xiamenense]|uniref:DUF423 domain-containing protein n=1 Tax=Cyclobacterium xiamenense TaxID=1297121 RepID=A0A1H7BZM6_9BACT|nr:hypothetical protein [Cyclobacterium xiamenense]SEJ82656.1 hypothetical protein SAMN05192553_1215 [Cyclobacterium xiamenense]
MKKIYIKIAGIVNLITALIHSVAGQMDLVNPLINSNLEVQQKAEWVGVWHIVTVLLFATSYLFLKVGFDKAKMPNSSNLKAFGITYILIGIPFIISSIYYSVLAPQWILLMPIGILLLIGHRKLD